MFDHILIPTDGSEAIGDVVDRAAALVEDGGALHSVFVVDTRALLPLSEDEQRSVAETLKTEGDTALDAVAEAIDASGVDTTLQRAILQGIPARQILGYAAQNDIDAIVLGTHGRTMQNQAIGSTVERVVRGINQLDETDLVIVPIGPGDDEDSPQDALPEQAREMFQ